MQADPRMSCHSLLHLSPFGGIASIGGPIAGLMIAKPGSVQVDDQLSDRSGQHALQKFDVRDCRKCRRNDTLRQQRMERKAGAFQCGYLNCLVQTRACFNIAGNHTQCHVPTMQQNYALMHLVDGQGKVQVSTNILIYPLCEGR